ncbi:hypothetical protein CLU79DRAFT_831331 [Phycomyces nitens]|nr:hypothetical protein CLU79DRAFT_831331 [Phycomyces nitens]
MPTIGSCIDKEPNERRFLETEDDDVARIGDALGYAAQILYRFGIPLDQGKNAVGEKEKKKVGNIPGIKTTKEIEISIASYEGNIQEPQIESDTNKLTSKDGKKRKGGSTFRRGRGRPLKFSIGRGRPRKLYSGTAEKIEAKAQSLRSNYLIFYS